jgi:hypothetical protein
LTGPVLAWTPDEPRPPAASAGGALMVDLAAIGLAVACFAFIFVLLDALERV